MSEQKLISKYLVNKVPIKYEEIKTNLQKKNKKIMNYLVSLTFYQPEESISEFIVPYSLSGSSSDKKLNQLASYFLCHAFGDECKAITNSINLFQKELDNKSNALYKKMLAMKVMSIFLSPLDNLAKSNLLNHISEGLRATMHKSTDKNKKKKGSVREKCLWEYSAISTLKHKFKMAPSIFIPIVDCLKSEYAAVTRNAAILCYNHAVEEPQKVASTFTKFSEIVSTKKDPEIEFNLKDPIAKIYLIKMFTQLANSSEVTNADLFYGAITYFAQDKNMRVSFEAITAFTKIPTWEKFEDFVIPYEEKKLIKIAIDKLSQGLLNTESLPMIHNAARVVAILAESHREFIGDVVTEEDGQIYPLEDIVEPLKTLLNNESVHIRAQALKAFIWLTSSSDGYEVEKKITVEFIRNKFPGFLFDEIFEELKRRTEKTPKMASNTLDIVFCWCKHLPEKANMRIIGEIWNAVMKFPGGNALVVENIYTILDIENQSKDRDFLHFVKKNVYFFLGEHSHILSATPQQEGNYFASIKNNPTLKSIVLRLENAASIGSTEVRSLAVIALAKTAFRSNFETRLHIFQFLNNMDESVTSKIDVFPVLQILDRLFNSLKKWNVVVKQSFGGDLSTEQQEQFQKDNKALLNDISYYCDEFKDSFCALGPKFSQFL